MITLNTNLGSLIVQSNLKASTNGLNTAIERMTSGFKISHAKDNAANYSISTNLSSKLSSYDVAQDNVSTGLDMLTTAMDNLDLISSHLSRIRDLTEQAANGTYGEASLKAIQSEVDARVSEINRIISNTEYNKIKLFEGDSSSGVTGSFINEVVQLSEEEALAHGYTLIKTADELQQIESNLSGKYILMNDIDLSGYDWTPLGISAMDGSSQGFTGELNGNGHVVRNLRIHDSSEVTFAGLFALISAGGIVSNLGLEDVDIDCSGADSYAGGLAVISMGVTVTNCYTTGVVSATSGDSGAGGLIYSSEDIDIDSCYSSCTVSGMAIVGGLLGAAGDTISSCYSTGAVSGLQQVGGLIGLVGVDSTISSCYSTGAVSATDYVGGLIGVSDDITISKSYFNTETSGQTAGVGEVASGTAVVTGVTTSELNALIQNGTLPQASAGSASISGGSKEVTLQVGINSDTSSVISVDIGIGQINLNIDVTSSESARNALATLDDNLKKISEKQTEYGSAYNRLESALESIAVSIDNLTSTQSTIRDADIAEESSAYIRNQILQQASATLLATANQTPAIALQLL